METEEAASESRIEYTFVDALVTRMYNIRGTKGSSQAMDIFAGISTDGSHEECRLLGLPRKSRSGGISNVGLEDLGHSLTFLLLPTFFAISFH